MNKYTRNIGYIAISTVFFSFLVFLITNSYPFEIFYFGKERYDAISFFLGLVSCAGVFVFLHSIKNEVQMWHLGLPLLVTIVVVTISSLLSPIFPEYFGYPMDGNATPFNLLSGQIMPYLLAPFSALFFYSLKEMKGDVRILTLISFGISILFSGSLFIEIPMYDVSMSFLLYWVYGMPLIGALYLASCTGFNYPKPQRPERPEGSKSPSVTLNSGSSDEHDAKHDARSGMEQLPARSGTTKPGASSGH